jgi:hypothetical protein
MDAMQKAANAQAARDRGIADAKAADASMKKKGGGAAKAAAVDPLKELEAKLMPLVKEGDELVKAGELDVRAKPQRTGLRTLREILAA